MYPAGHARNTMCDLKALLEHKFGLLAGLGVDDTGQLVGRFTNLAKKSPQEIDALYDFEIRGLAS